MTPGNQAPVTNTGMGAAAGVLTINPNEVGAVLVINFPFNQPSLFNPGDVYEIIFTDKFVLPDDGSISAVIDGVALTVYVYTEAYMVHLEVPTAETVAAGAKTLTLS
mmetsp:Transcript_13854/g.11832  ORF Transcript_13854/g.11832 Transcript_13854/m.11832 type:complete len:107 (+) Transcript_13854:6139-6459(+)